MSMRWSVGLVVLALVSSEVGCATPYAPPTMAQPHAILKLRRTYQSSGGTHMRESLTIEEHPAFAADAEREAAGAARTDALLVHPTPAELRVAAGFFHTEMRTVQESYSVQVPYTTTETYSCGSGTSYQTCSRTVTHYRSETRYRMVTKPVEVSDGSCAGALWFSPALDGSYIVEYEYAQNGLCRVVCFDQVQGAEPGTFVNRPCALPTPAEMRKARKAR
jgi:hypothetical protein